jgi:hypothetical protein
MNKCWGFIDGTFRRISRPRRIQEVCYNGHKRGYGIKFQSILTPDGIIRKLYGPIEGSRHDAFMFAISGLNSRLEEHQDADVQDCFYLYGDAGYQGMSRDIYNPFINPERNSAQSRFNTEISRVHESEWIWTYYLLVCLSGLQQELKAISSASGKVLCCRLHSDKCANLLVWKSNHLFF